MIGYSYGIQVVNDCMKSWKEQKIFKIDVPGDSLAMSAKDGTTSAVSTDSSHELGTHVARPADSHRKDHHSTTLMRDRLQVKVCEELRRL